MTINAFKFAASTVPPLQVFEMLSLTIVLQSHVQSAMFDVDIKAGCEGHAALLATV